MSAPMGPQPGFYSRSVCLFRLTTFISFPKNKFGIGGSKNAAQANARYARRNVPCFNPIALAHKLFALGP
jgi:hypothetical protein